MTPCDACPNFILQPLDLNCFFFNFSKQLKLRFNYNLVIIEPNFFSLNFSKATSHQIEILKSLILYIYIFLLGQK